METRFKLASYIGAKVGPAFVLFALAAPDWTAAYSCLLPCGQLASNVVREYALLWIIVWVSSGYFCLP